MSFWSLLFTRMVFILYNFPVRGGRPQRPWETECNTSAKEIGPQINLRYLVMYTSQENRKAICLIQNDETSEGHQVAKFI